MQQASTPLWGQILAVLTVPGIMAGVLWFVLAGISMGSHGGILTERAKRRRRLWIKGFLWVMYPGAFGMLLWARIWPPGTRQPGFARAIGAFFRAPHPVLWDSLGYVFLVPIFALLLWAFGRWLLAAAGIGGNMPFSKRRFLKEWLWVLAGVYAYILGALLLGVR